MGEPGGLPSMGSHRVGHSGMRSPNPEEVFGSGPRRGGVCACPVSGSRREEGSSTVKQLARAVVSETSTGA